MIGDGEFGDWGFEDDTLDMVREQFRRFAEEQIVPHAHGWHTEDVLIPLEVIEALAEMGVFGLTVPEDWGGLGMGKAAMCVVTEELARGYIGVGSLGTRSEIAAELIRLAGTAAQKAKYLPRIASGEIIPTAVFTEPEHRLGSRLVADPGGARGRLLPADRSQDLDHPCRARRSDDHPVPHRSERARPPRPLDPARREAAGQRMPSRFRCPGSQAARSRFSAIAA